MAVNGAPMIIESLFALVVIAGCGNYYWNELGPKEDDFGTRLLMTAALGIAFTVIMSSLYGIFGVLKPELLVAAAGVFAICSVIGRKNRFVIGPIDRGWLAAIGCFILLLHIFMTGAFASPLLEDDDSWQHAAAVRYIAETGSFMQPEPRLIHYLSPYPPMYDAMVAMVYKAGDMPLNVVLKGVNAFLCALTVLFGYVWARNRFGGNIAIFFVLFLTALPCFMSHFIWAQTLAITLIFPSLYFIDRHNASHKATDAVAGIMCMGALAIVQPSVAGVFLVMTLIYQARHVMKNVTGSVAIPFFSVLVAFVFFWGPMAFIYGPGTVAEHISILPSFFTDKEMDTGGGIVYELIDFLDPPFISRMDQPTGIGYALVALMLVGIYSSLERKEHHDMLALLVFCLIGVEGNLFPVKVMPHRFWVFLSIPVALMASVGMCYILDKTKHKYIMIAVVAIAMIAVALTSFGAKYVVETSSWPSGVNFVSTYQLAGYARLSQVMEPDTKIFSFCGHEDLANGIGMFGYSWDDEVRDYKKIAIVDTIDNNLDFLGSRGYEYAVLDHACVSGFTPQQVERKIHEMVDSGMFWYDEEKSSESFVVFRVAG